MSSGGREHGVKTQLVSRSCDLAQVIERGRTTVAAEPGDHVPTVARGRVKAMGINADTDPASRRVPTEFLLPRPELRVRSRWRASERGMTGASALNMTYPIGFVNKGRGQAAGIVNRRSGGGAWPRCSDPRAGPGARAPR